MDDSLLLSMSQDIIQRPTMGLIKYTIDYYAYGVALLLSRGFVLALPEL